MEEKIDLGDKFYGELSRLPRSWLLGGLGLKRTMRLLGQGTTPWLTRHLMPGFDGHIGYDDFWEMMVKSSLYLRKNPEVKGVFGCSWYYDPIVSAITPNLSFTTQMTRGCGGYVFPVPTSETMHNDALKTSRRRRHKHKYGLYHPQAYCAAIPRRALLARF